MFGSLLPAFLLALSAKLLELGEHRAYVEFAFRLGRRLRGGGLRFLACGGLGSGQQSHAGVDRRWLFLVGAVDLEIEIDLRAQPKRDRIHWRERGSVPMGAVADRRDSRLGGAHQPHYRAVLEL